MAKVFRGSLRFILEARNLEQMAIRESFGNHRNYHPNSMFQLSWVPSL